MTVLAEKGTTIHGAQKEILVIEVLKKQIIRGLIIYLLVSNVFVFLRMVLRLFGADPATAFAGFVYAISALFLLPFFGMFPQFRDTITPGQPTVDYIAFIALFCSNILVLLAMSIVFLVARMMKTRTQATETVEKSKPVDATTAEESVD